MNTRQKAERLQELIEAKGFTYVEAVAHIELEEILELVKESTEKNKTKMRQLFGLPGEVPAVDVTPYKTRLNWIRRKLRGKVW